MKRFLLLIVVMAVGLIACYLLVFWTMCKIELNGSPLIYRTSLPLNLKGGNSYRKFREFDPAVHYDAIFIGSSHAYRGYDPVVFAEHGYDSFNLGSSAQSPLNSYFIIHQYLDASNTGLLVFDVYEGAMEMDGLESTADLSQNMTSDRAAWGMAWATKDLLAFNMLLLRHFRQEAPSMFEGIGYREQGAAMSADSVKQPLSYDRDRPLRMLNSQQKYLERSLVLCRERGIPVVLVSHPYPKAADRDRHEEFRKYVIALCAKLDLQYLDLAFDHSLDDRDHFYDHNHLNIAGAAIFNERLIGLLEERGWLSQGP